MQYVLCPSKLRTQTPHVANGASLGRPDLPSVYASFFFPEEDAVDLDSLDILKDSLQQYMDDEVNPRSTEQFLSMSL